MSVNPSLLSPQEAVRKLATVLAHAWMIRTFLKHAEEIQDSEEMMEVPRTLYDGIRAVEPAWQRGDYADYLRRLQGKLPKFRRIARYFSENYRRFSPHTNYEMAAASLLGVVERIEEILDQTDWDAVRSLPPVPKPERPSDPIDELDIPEV